MARGTGGYGRYEDSPAYVGCPWARSSESPCVARDGQLALSSGSPIVCVGCGNSVRFLIRDLADDYMPAGSQPIPDNPDKAANWFRDLVFQATAPLAERETGDRPEPPPG